MIKVSPCAKYKIKLTMSDAKKFQASVQEYATAPTQKLKMQMLDIYTPYINRKVQADTYGKDISKSGGRNDSVIYRRRDTALFRPRRARQGERQGRGMRRRRGHP